MPNFIYKKKQKNNNNKEIKLYRKERNLDNFTLEIHEYLGMGEGE